MGLIHRPMLTSPQTHKATAKCIESKCIESLSNKKWKCKTGCGLVNISVICRAEGTSGKEQTYWLFIVRL